MREEWKDIPGFEGNYQVSNLGNIRSVDRIIWCKTHFRRYIGKVLRAAKFTKQGHLSLILGKHCTGKTVHELVMLAFIGPRPKGFDICHNDGDATNNRLDNLRYGTRSENNRDKRKHGRLKISDSHIRQIKTREKPGTWWAKKLGVSQSLVYAIRNGRLHVE